MSVRYLTKSRFKVGHECRTKLYYLDNPAYQNSKEADAFLKALADGGFQVGELAKVYFEGGVEVKEREHKKAADETKELLKRENVVIFEAAIMFENYFVRVDVLEKKGSVVRLLEVKAKSWRDGDSFTTKKGTRIDSGWEPYIADIAFQTYVARKAYPEFRHLSFLMLADKDAKASVDGIHQRFILKSADGSRTQVEVVPGTTKISVGAPLLKAIPVDNEVAIFLEQTFDGKGFEDYLSELSLLAVARKRANPSLSRTCGACEYRVEADEIGDKNSGFEECWQQSSSLKLIDLRSPLIFDIWNLHYMKKDSLIQQGRIRMRDVVRDDIEPEDDDSIELTAKQRQWMQVEKYKTGSKQPFFDTERFLYRGSKVDKWSAPFHFIDFETLTSAIPFNRGLRPYETIAFQFSHHVIDKHGKVVHQSQFIETSPGKFPNFEFVRKLKLALGNDNGTVFRYATHENTVLNHIRNQLLDSQEPDCAELISFIESLTTRKEGGKEVHRGSRAMVDMCELVKRYYYSPLMGGSNSIKRVLPSVLQESQYLRNKYSKNTYGSCDELKSQNFIGKTWVQFGPDGTIVDPYSTLGPVFDDIDPATWEQFERVYQDDEIREGGAASTAYARMQFTKMSHQERAAIERALLKYCELDTLAMVMIWEYWTHELVNGAKDAA